MKKIFAALLLVTLSLAHAKAADCNDPKQFINDYANQILPILRDPVLSENQKQQQFVTIFDQIINYGWMSEYVLGQEGSKLSAAQKEDFRQAYRQYIISSYIGKLNDFTGHETVTVKDIGAMKDQTSQIAKITVINSPGDEDDFSILLKKSDSCFKLSDVMAEGVSILKTEKQDFSNILKTQGFEALIQTLKDKSAKPK